MPILGIRFNEMEVLDEFLLNGKQKVVKATQKKSPTD